MQNQAPQTPELAALPVPSRDQAYEAGLRRLATLLNRDEQTWIVGKTFDEQHTFWRFDIVRPGSMGRWVLQRYRYDGQSETLYFLGERQLSSTQLSEARRNGEAFLVADWQNRS